MRLVPLLFFLACTGLASPAPAQKLVSATYLGSRTKAQLATLFNLPIFQYDVKYYRVNYISRNLAQKPDTLSGLIAVPVAPGKAFPRLVYQHGTSGSKQDVPSQTPTNGEGQTALLFAGLGYVALAPDYLGLGISADVFHPYIHAESEAWAALDMLRALPEFASQENTAVTDQLFVTGYSQGGHAAMALQRAIETDPAKEFVLTASAPMSGPYSLSREFLNFVLADNVYNYPAYLPNVILAFQTVYGNLFTNLTDVFQPVYTPTIQQFYDNKISLNTLNTNLVSLLKTNAGASKPRALFQPAVLAAIQADPNHPINVALRANDVFNFKALAPTRLFYCKADDQVPYQNSLVALDSLIARGGLDVEAKDVNTTANHGGCVAPALTNTILFFGGFQKVDAPEIPAEGGSGLLLLPNPASERFSLKGLPGGAVQITLTDTQGRLSRRIDLENAALEEIVVADLPEGFYLITAHTAGRQWQGKLLVKR